jgi:hypothetical protein
MMAIASGMLNIKPPKPAIANPADKTTTRPSLAPFLSVAKTTSAALINAIGVTIRANIPDTVVAMMA